MQSLDYLNKEFALPGHLEFKEGPAGCIFADIKNESGSAEVFLHGAQITSYIPKDNEPVFFLSGLSKFEEGKAIRGGIPVSWPWFADHPTDGGKPAHGFARTSTWHIIGTEQKTPSETLIRLGLTDSGETRKLFNHRFDLEIVFTIGSELNVKLRMKNTDKEDFTVTSAFHSYYRVHNVPDVSVHGLDGLSFIDKVDDFKTKTQHGPLRITGETDKIYLNTEGECVIEDPGFNRSIRINKSGSSSTVVWNPWEEKAGQMQDLGDRDYLNFVCVETANAGDDTVTISPGEQHELQMNIVVEDMLLKIYRGSA